MGFFDIQSPRSLRLTLGDGYDQPPTATPSQFIMFQQQAHDAHPSMGRLMFLVFGAVLEVVCVSLPGYIIARMGHFDADKQKFLANLNVMLFTPCLSRFSLIGDWMRSGSWLLTVDSLHEACLATQRR